MKKEAIDDEFALEDEDDDQFLDELDLDD